MKNAALAAGFAVFGVVTAAGAQTAAIAKITIGKVDASAEKMSVHLSAVASEIAVKRGAVVAAKAVVTQRVALETGNGGHERVPVIGYGLEIGDFPRLSGGRATGREMARACEVGPHKKGNVPRMPAMPETTSRPRNPDEDDFVHCSGPNGSDVAPTLRRERTSPRRTHPHRGRSLDLSRVVLL
jgi:hypothetical protein